MTSHDFVFVVKNQADNSIGDSLLDADKVEMLIGSDPTLEFLQLP